MSENGKRLKVELKKQARRLWPLLPGCNTKWPLRERKWKRKW